MTPRNAAKSIKNHSNFQIEILNHPQISHSNLLLSNLEGEKNKLGNLVSMMSGEETRMREKLQEVLPEVSRLEERLQEVRL